jgi:hypothetical protein
MDLFRESSIDMSLLRSCHCDPDICFWQNLWLLLVCCRNRPLAILDAFSQRRRSLSYWVSPAQRSPNQAPGPKGQRRGDKCKQNKPRILGESGAFREDTNNVRESNQSKDRPRGYDVRFHRNPHPLRRSMFDVRCSAFTSSLPVVAATDIEGPTLNVER